MMGNNIFNCDCLKSKEDIEISESLYSKILNYKNKEIEESTAKIKRIREYNKVLKETYLR